MLPEHQLSISILTNSIDGPATEWILGAISILASFARKGAPVPRVRDWSGRWWGIWGAADLVPMGCRVTISYPSQMEPFASNSEVVVTGNDRGRIAEAAGGANYGEVYGVCEAQTAQSRKSGSAGRDWSQNLRPLPRSVIATSASGTLNCASGSNSTLGALA